MESAWKDILAVDCTFEFKTFNMTLNGKEDIWAFRQQLTLNGDNARLDWRIFAGSYSIDSDGIVRTSTDMVAYKNDASTYELGRFSEIILWTASFNDEGLMSTVTIEQLWYDYEDGDFGRRRISGVQVEVRDPGGSEQNLERRDAQRARTALCPPLSTPYSHPHY